MPDNTEAAPICRTETHSWSNYSAGRCRCDLGRAAWRERRRSRERIRWARIARETGLTRTEYVRRRREAGGA